MENGFQKSLEDLKFSESLTTNYLFSSTEQFTSSFPQLGASTLHANASSLPLDQTTSLAAQPVQSSARYYLQSQQQKKAKQYLKQRLINQKRAITSLIKHTEKLLIAEIKDVEQQKVNEKTARVKQGIRTTPFSPRIKTTMQQHMFGSPLPVQEVFYPSNNFQELEDSFSPRQMTPRERSRSPPTSPRDFITTNNTQKQQKLRKILPNLPSNYNRPKSASSSYPATNNNTNRIQSASPQYLLSYNNSNSLEQMNFNPSVEAEPSINTNVLNEYEEMILSNRTLRLDLQNAYSNLYSEYARPFSSTASPNRFNNSNSLTKKPPLPVQEKPPMHFQNKNNNARRPRTAPHSSASNSYYQNNNSLSRTPTNNSLLQIHTMEEEQLLSDNPYRRNSSGKSLLMKSGVQNSSMNESVDPQIFSPDYQADDDKTRSVYLPTVLSRFESNDEHLSYYYQNTRSSVSILPNNNNSSSHDYHEEPTSPRSPNRTALSRASDILLSYDDYQENSPGYRGTMNNDRPPLVPPHPKSGGDTRNENNNYFSYHHRLLNGKRKEGIAAAIAIAEEIEKMENISAITPEGRFPYNSKIVMEHLSIANLSEESSLGLESPEKVAQPGLPNNNSKKKIKRPSSAVVTNPASTIRSNLLMKNQNNPRPVVAIQIPKSLQQSSQKL
jgi:hypothetical protein